MLKGHALTTEWYSAVEMGNIYDNEQKEPAGKSAGVKVLKPGRGMRKRTVSINNKGWGHMGKTGLVAKERKSNANTSGAWPAASCCQGYLPTGTVPPKKLFMKYLPGGSLPARVGRHGGAPWKASFPSLWSLVT